MAEGDGAGLHRHAAQYSDQETRSLRIIRVHFIPDHILFLLSDGKSLCLPLSVDHALRTASADDRYLWHVIGNGRAVVWYTPRIEVHLNLQTMLAHPDARIIELPPRSA